MAKQARGSINVVTLDGVERRMSEAEFNAYLDTPEVQASCKAFAADMAAYTARTGYAPSTDMLTGRCR